MEQILHKEHLLIRHIIYGSLPSNYQKDIVKILGQKKIKTFLGTIDSIEYDQETRSQHDKNFTLLKPYHG